MPYRVMVAKELAELCKLAAHPDRIRIIENLKPGPQDVSSLASKLEISGSRVSQHLSLLKVHRLVEEHREGRHHYYALTQPKLADWLLLGLEFIASRRETVSPEDIEAARREWSSDETEWSAAE